MGIKNYEKKKNACAKALEFMPEKGTVGLGSGSTVKVLAHLIPKKPGRQFVCVSEKAKNTLSKRGLKVVKKSGKITAAFDGADAIIGGAAIKGGGALDFTEEKKLDYSAQKLFLIIDDTKSRIKKGKIFVEINRKAYARSVSKIRGLGLDIKKVPKNNSLLSKKKNPFVYFFAQKNLEELEEKLEGIPGVEGCGIFAKKKFKIIRGRKEGAEVQ